MSSKEAKDIKHKPEGARQPQRKDSLSSVLQWAGLQGKMIAPKAVHPTSTTTGTLTTTAATTPGQNSPKPRRHSHSVVDGRKKTLSLALDHPKVPTPETATTSTTSITPKTTKSSSSDKVNKTAPTATATPTAADGAAKKTDHGMALPNGQEKPRSPEPHHSPTPMPKSILRVSSPDGYRRPRFADLGAVGNGGVGLGGSTNSPPPIAAVTPAVSGVVIGPASPASPIFSATSLESPPGSPPMLPIPTRPLSPSVRFAKATIHRVEVGPGRRFTPVKRKSKSTLTYISPLDPGTQKSPPRTMLQSPTKLKRHQENQAAMGRYWLRTEEEEAAERAEAERRAEEEAERYRLEPPAAEAVTRIQPAAVATATSVTPVVDGLVPIFSLDDVKEEAVEDSEDDDEDAGAKCTLEEPIVIDLTEADGPGEKGLQAGPERKEGSMPLPCITEQAEGDIEPETAKIRAAKPDVLGTTSGPSEKSTAPTPAPQSVSAEKLPTEISQAKSFYERLAEKEAAEQRVRRQVQMEKPPRSSSIALVPSAAVPASDTKEKHLAPPVSGPSRAEPGSGRSSGSDVSSSSSSSLGSGSSSGSGTVATTTATKTTADTHHQKERERDHDRDRNRERRSSRNMTGSRPLSGLKSATPSPGYEKTSTQPRTGSPRGGTNHLHLSGRRGRRYMSEHGKHEITA